MHFFKYQSSTEVLMFGPVLKSSDGHSRSTGLSLTTAPAFKLSKPGSTFVNRDDTGAVTARYGGYYTVPLSSADLGSYGTMRIDLQTSSGRLPTWEYCQVVSDNVHDSLFGGSTYLKVDTQTIEGADATTQITDAVLNSTLEYSYTVKQGLRIMAAALAGRSTGAGSTDLKFQAMGSSDKNRINAACGSSGNRQGVTLDATT